MRDSPLSKADAPPERVPNLLQSTEAAGGNSKGILIDAVRASGMMSEVFKALSGSQTFSVVFREAAKGNLHQVGPSLYEAAVRNSSGQYVQRVLLRPSGMNVAGAISALAVQIMLVDISNRLDRLQASIDRFQEEQRAARRGRVMAALRQLDTVHLNKKESTREQTLVGARSALNAEFHTACANLSDKSSRVPDPSDWSYFNFFGSSQAEKVNVALDELQFEAGIAVCCANALGQIELLLNGGEATSDILKRAVTDLRQVIPFAEIQDKARRIPIARGCEPPDRYWIKLESTLEGVEQRLDQLRYDEAAIVMTGAELFGIDDGRRPSSPNASVDDVLPR